MSSAQRRVLLVAILASFVAFLDGSVVNVALPAIVRDLGGGLSLQQWVVDAYLITLGSLILIAGSFSDIFGRKKVLYAGLLGFLVASVLCAASPNGTFLVVARALQGAAGALLVPSSLALIMSAFDGPAEGKAIGSWTAWTGIAFVIGPLLGGFLVDAASWRYIFAINVIPIALTIWLLKDVSEEPATEAAVKVDVPGAVMCALALACLGYGLIEQAHYGWGSPLIYGTLAFGGLLSAVFLWYESRAAAPMLPLGLFKIRDFWVGNIATFAIYGGLSIATFLVVVYVQQVGGYSAIQAGLALLPVTIIMFFMSSRFGALSGRYGPRRFMTLGPLVAASGFLYMLRVGEPLQYATQLLPGILLFGLGLSMTVAPLTSAILGSVDKRQSGIASAVNNAIARIAGLVVIAALALIIGKHLDLAGFHRGVAVTAALLILGGIVSFAGIRSSKKQPTQP
jgi:EmrB/QacA subfamily drug resistance transporter